jgi:hypothetical protein
MLERSTSMRTYRYPVNYRTIYEQTHGPIPYDQDGRRYEIHHVDGNHNNNHIDNLKAVTIKEHYDIHYAQEDWGACLLIAQRMALSPAVISDLARRNTLRKNLREVAAGTHVFLGGKIQRRRNEQQVKDGTHHWLGPATNLKRVAEGRHNLVGPDSNLTRLAERRHPSQMKRVCEHCGKEFSVSMYVRWHGDNCRNKS